MGTALAWFGDRLARYLSKQVRDGGLAPPVPVQQMVGVMQAGDVLLVEGHSRFSTAVKYLTQSTWSHASLFVGFRWQGHPQRHTHCFVEADVRQGVRTVGAAEYADLHSRICRPVGLTPEECERLCQYAINHVGDRYDLRNVIDLLRYLLPLPPVPPRFRRQMLSLGSGDPTRAICSTLIAQAFESIRYPIFPIQTHITESADEEDTLLSLVLGKRHHSFIAPRDFDVSPYFDIIKPSVENGFDYHVLHWLDEQTIASCK